MSIYKWNGKKLVLMSGIISVKKITDMVNKK